MLLVLLAGCLINEELYLKRLAELGDTGDEDGDTVGDDTAETADSTDSADGSDTGEPPSDLDHDGFSAEEGDCDDQDPDRHPGAEETCDGVDQDCDDVADDGASDASTGWADVDGDGYGDPMAPLAGCPPLDAVANDEDCDDGDAWVHPGARERLDGVTNDCNATGLMDRVEGDEADLVLVGEATGDQAGAIVSLPGDLDADGAPDLLVGAPGAERAYLWAGGLTSGSLADAALAIDGWDGEVLVPAGADGVVVGVDGGLALVAADERGVVAPTAELDGAWTSFAVTEDRSGATVWLAGEAGGASGWWGGWSGDATWTASGAAGDVAVAPAGDLDGDGAAEVLVADPAGDAVYVYTLEEGDVDAGDALATLSAETTGDALGTVASAAGDLDGDGQDDLLLGAPGVDDGGTDVGRVYVVYGPVRGPLTMASAGGWVKGRGGGDRLGTAVAGSFDIEGDAAADFLIGLPFGEVNSTQDGGGVFFFDEAVFGEASTGDSAGAVTGYEDDALIGTGVSVGWAWGTAGLALAVGAQQHEEGQVWVYYTDWR